VSEPSCGGMDVGPDAAVGGGVVDDKLVLTDKFSGIASFVTAAAAADRSGSRGSMADRDRNWQVCCKCGGG